MEKVNIQTDNLAVKELAEKINQLIDLWNSQDSIEHPLPENWEIVKENEKFYLRIPCEDGGYLELEMEKSKVDNGE